MLPMTHRAISRGLLACATLLFMAACGEGATEPQPGGLTVLSPPAEVSDTVAAYVAEPLVVEVRNEEGQRQEGVAVRFEASVTGLGEQVVPTVYLSGSTPDNFQPETQVVTDATGRAAVRVRLGMVAGPAAVSITVPTLGYSGHAQFEVVRGATVRTTLLPLDTAVYVGSSYALRATQEDRFGNAVSVAVTSAVSDAPAIAAAAASITGVAPGRTRVVATVGGAQFPLHVSVVPQGTLLAAGPGGIYTFGLDGSGYRRVVTESGVRSPRWLPDGQRFVFSQAVGHGRLSDLNGATRTLVQDANPLEAELWPHPSRDGQWVYFGGYSGAEFRGYLHRVRPDGTGLQLVPGFAPNGHTQSYPSPSPEGDRVAYFYEGTHSRDVSIRVLNLLTGQLVVLGVSGHSPEWSHGDSIAYVDSEGGESGPIRLMSSAGQGHRQAGAGVMYGFGIDWSPDDQWIVARDVQLQRLEIIRVATGERIPLPYSQGMYDPAWKL
jgi:hypothetical protein